MKTKKKTAEAAMLKKQLLKTADSAEAVDSAKGYKTQTKLKRKKLKTADAGGPKVLEGGGKKAKTLKSAAAQKPGTKRKVDSGDKENDNEESEAKRPKLEEPSQRKLDRMKRIEKKHQRKKTMINNYELMQRAKILWNDLRSHEMESGKRASLCAELMNLIKGQAKELVFRHDTCRVVQCVMKYGTVRQRSTVFEELKNEIVELTKTRYANHFIRKVMKYGTKEEKEQVFAAYEGNVRKLMRHREASKVLEYCYNDYANVKQRQSMVEEFYGPRYALFKKDDEIRTLESIMNADDGKNKETVLASMKETLEVIADKNITQHSLVHRIYHEFFQYATGQMRSEMIEIVRENLLPMMHTRDGSRAAMHCIWHGSSKDRKIIVKSLKDFVLKLCLEEYGHLVLLAVFDSVDDTIMVQKVVLNEIMKNLAEVVKDQYGRKVLHYLVNPRDPRHFHPDIVKILELGDGNAISKKDKEVRYKELLDYASPKLFNYLASNTESLIKDNANANLLLIADILTQCPGDSTRALTAFAELVVKPYPGDKPDSHLLVTAAGHMAIKKLIQNDKKRMENDGEKLFSSIVLDLVAESDLKAWTSCNRGCFTLITMLELGNDELAKRIQNSLRNVRKYDTDIKGAQILSKKLDVLW